MPLPSLSLPLSASTVAANLLILSCFGAAARSETEHSLVNTEHSRQACIREY